VTGLVFHPPIQTILKQTNTKQWYTDMVNVLESVGDDPNLLDEFGEAPLCVAAHRAQGVVVEELLQRINIKVNIKGKHGRTPLYVAAEEGHVYIVKCLLQHPDIDLNMKNAPGGATALMGASRRGHSRIVELLLQHPECDPSIADLDGHTAVHHARTHSISIKINNQASKSRSLGDIFHVQNSESHFVKSWSAESIVSDDPVLDENQLMNRPLIPPPPYEKVSTSILKKLHFLAVKKTNKNK